MLAKVPSNQAKRQQIALWVLGKNGSDAWGYYKNHSSQYSASSYKCAAYVCDALKDTGANSTVSVPDVKGGSLARCPTAADSSDKTRMTYLKSMAVIKFTNDPGRLEEIAEAPPTKSNFL
ncbi:hypothetical protein [Xanthomonas hortorum]|uniref:hypothetical protein n=1 Tax=Xanthomonas hortorum TaxID=56454 RepID=UPI0011128894|nr:hypothetical protein [Xanthomonas hortorum]MCC8500963.1 hypothetical protein [Xanthomonas hortorum pv. gardneri]MCC8508646.1 hypothetical protein [Xanthomonas hortorum pv. gardneri]MCC8512882.1 hypothetical protein [Xanthomonas hortorum pv. gardneri]MCC8521702.1 hypothetical protein [Xanthomonas hortorum pv. gardneri]MCC8525979.1 hypothetical protein [Xanthomonas hortorum pv. gardneri]